MALVLHKPQPGQPLIVGSQHCYAAKPLNGAGEYTISDGFQGEYLTGIRNYQPMLVYVPNSIADADVLTAIAGNNPGIVRFGNGDVVDKYRIAITGEGSLTSPSTQITLTQLPTMQAKGQVLDTAGAIAEFTNTESKVYTFLAVMKRGGVEAYAYQTLDFASNNPTDPSDLQFATAAGKAMYYADGDEIAYYMVETAAAPADLSAVLGGTRYSAGQIIKNGDNRYTSSFKVSGNLITATLNAMQAGDPIPYSVVIELLNKTQDALSKPLPPDQELSYTHYFVYASLKPKTGSDQPVAWAIIKVNKDELNNNATWSHQIGINDFQVCDSSLNPTGATMGYDPDLYDLSLRLLGAYNDYSDPTVANRASELLQYGDDKAPKGYDFLGVFVQGGHPRATEVDTSYILLHTAYDKNYGIRVYTNPVGMEVEDSEKYVVRVTVDHETTGNSYAFADLVLDGTKGSASDPATLTFHKFTDSDNNETIWCNSNGSPRFDFTGNEKNVRLDVLAIDSNGSVTPAELIKSPSAGKYTLVKPGDSINLYTLSYGDREVEENQGASRLDVYDVLIFNKDTSGVTIGELQNALSDATNFGLYTEVLSVHGTDMESNIGAAVVTGKMGADYGFSGNNVQVNQLKVTKKYIGSDGQPAPDKPVVLKLYPVESINPDTGDYVLGSAIDPTESGIVTNSNGVATIVFNKLVSGNYVLKEVINGQEYSYRMGENGIVSVTDDLKVTFQDDLITIENININVNYFGSIVGYNSPGDYQSLIRHSRNGWIVTDSDADYEALVAANGGQTTSTQGRISKTGSTEYPYTYDIPSDMANLRSLSSRLASSSSSPTVKIMNVTLDELNGKDIPEIRGDGRFVVVNVDMSNAGSVATVNVKTKFNGTVLDADFGKEGSEYSSKVLYNFVCGTSPYTGKINTTGVGAGVLLAPSAIVADLGGNWGGTIVCREAQHTGSEIHSDSANKIQKINTLLTNSEKEQALGNLQVEKKFDSDEIVDRTTYFTFKITLKDENNSPVSGTFTATGIADASEVTFDNAGEATVQVRANNRIIISGLPNGTHYSVEEIETVQTEHYTFVEFQNADGTQQVAMTANGGLVVNGVDGDYSFNTSDEVTTGMLPADDEWHKVAVAIRDQNYFVYVDGEKRIDYTPQTSYKYSQIDMSKVVDFMAVAPYLYIGENSYETVEDKAAEYAWLVDDIDIYRNTITEKEWSYKKNSGGGGGETDIEFYAPVYFQSFDGYTGDCTIYGAGSIVYRDQQHGKVFANVSTTPRSNYLVMPSDLFTLCSETQEITISFWVNRGTQTAGYFYAPLFSAYGQHNPAENTFPMMACQTRGLLQVNNAGWSDYTNEQNVKGANVESTEWLDDGKWHLYCATFTPTTAAVYIDGVVMNQWEIDGVGNTAAGLFTDASALQYICLGGNQAWNWADNDAGFEFDDFQVFDIALTPAQIQALLGQY